MKSVLIRKTSEQILTPLLILDILRDEFIYADHHY